MRDRGRVDTLALSLDTFPCRAQVCNLGSLCLPAFVVDGKFDYEGLVAAKRVLARNLDAVIDRNFYPIEEARRSNMRHRPIGIGVQGLQVSVIGFCCYTGLHGFLCFLGTLHRGAHFCTGFGECTHLALPFFAALIFALVSAECTLPFCAALLLALN